MDSNPIPSLNQFFQGFSFCICLSCVHRCDGLSYENFSSSLIQLDKNLPATEMVVYDS